MHAIAASRNVYRSVARRCVCCGSSSGEASTSRYLPAQRWTNIRLYGAPAYAEKEIEQERDLYSSGREEDAARHHQFVKVEPYNKDRTSSYAVAAPASSAEISAIVATELDIPSNHEDPTTAPYITIPASSEQNDQPTAVPLEPKAKKDKRTKSTTNSQLSPKEKRIQSRLALAARLRKAVSVSVPVSSLSEQLANTREPQEVQQAQGDDTVLSNKLISSSPPPNPDAPPELSALLRFQPKNSAPNRFHPRYAERYNHLHRRINGAFVRSQVVKLGNEMLRTKNLEEEMMSAPFDVGSANNGSITTETTAPTRSSKVKKLNWKMPKALAIKVILAEWGWPSLEEVERERKQLEMSNIQAEGTVELTNAEAYMISRDPQGWQRIAQTSKAQLSIRHEPTLAIHIKARVEDLSRCQEMIQQKQKGILQADFSVANYGGVRKELLRVISDATNTYVEAISDTMVRIHHLTAQQKTIAERLFRYAHINLDTLPRNTALAVLTAPLDALTQQTSKVIPTEFALYPIIPASHQIHEDRGIGSHWFLVGRGLFRLRRLGGWLGRIKWVKQSEKETLDDGHVDMVRTLDGAKVGRLSELLVDTKLTLPSHIEVQDVQRRVIAEMGHVVHTTLSTKDDQPRSSLLPPVTKSHKLSHFNNWVRSEDQLPIFMPTPATPENIKLLRGSDSKACRKLRYRQQTVVDSSSESGLGSGSERYLSFFCKLPDAGEKDGEKGMHGMNQSSSGLLEPATEQGQYLNSTMEEPVNLINPLAMTSFLSEERCIHVQIPDSANDLRLTQVVQGRLAFDVIPSKLLTYFAVVQGDNQRIRDAQPPRRLSAFNKNDKNYDLASIEDVELYSVVDEQGITHQFERSVTMSALPLTNTETYHKMEVAEQDAQALLHACRNAQL